MLLSTTTVSWADYSSWSVLMQVSVLLAALLAANIIREKISFIRKMLFPNALIAGILIFVVKLVFGLFKVDYEPIFSGAVMQIITYHALGIGFAALALKQAEKKKQVKFGKVIDSAALCGGAYMLQATVGLLVTLIGFGAIGYAGVILPLGYGQGPGNAMAWGGNYAASEGFTGGASFGLTVATMGFIVASVVGVVYMNVMRRRGKLHVRTGGEVQREDPVLNGNAPESGSVDKLSMNVALIALAYLLAYGFMWLLSATGIGLLDSLGWGLNFLWSLFFGFLIKFILEACKKKGMIVKEYRSNYLLDRVSGMAFDVMIVAGVAAIEWESVMAYWLPLTLLCTIGAVTTFVYIYIASHKVFPGYGHEAFLSNFGTYTGTVSNGMILLREVDPNFKTPAANNLVLSNSVSFLFNAPLFLLLGYVPKKPWLCLSLFAFLLVAYTVFLFRKAIFRRKKEMEWTEENGYGEDTAKEQEA